MGRYGVHTLAKTPQECSDVPGIVIRTCADDAHAPRIAAFVWGRRSEPARTLPFGRWKGVA